MNIEDLKPFQDREVELQLRDGEVLKASLTFVDEEYKDIIVEVIETNRPDNYKKPNSAYAIRASDILTVTFSRSK